MSKVQIINLDALDRAGGYFLQVHDCGLLPNTLHWDFDHSRSPFWRLYHNAAPGASLTISGRHLELVPERVIIIPPFTDFNPHGQDGIQGHLWIHFSPPLTLPVQIGELSRPVHPVLAATLGDLRQRLTLSHKPNAREVRLIYYSCLAVLNSWFVETPFEMSEPLPGPLNAMLQRIDFMLAEDLSNAFLARSAGLSLDGLRRLFLTHLGITPARYVASRRVREACRLLTFSDQSIEDIAEEVGFKNRHHFSRIFREHTVRGPARYRRENQHSASEGRKKRTRSRKKRD